LADGHGSGFYSLSANRSWAHVTVRDVRKRPNRTLRTWVRASETSEGSRTPDIRTPRTTQITHQRNTVEHQS
jgi:hypothetical protein